MVLKASQSIALVFCLYVCSEVAIESSRQVDGLYVTTLGHVQSEYD